MRKFSAADLAKILQVDIKESFDFDQVSTDSRSIVEGELFFAISGEHFNGNHCAVAAERSGAVACVVDEWQQELNIPQVVVNDTRLALGVLAK